MISVKRFLLLALFLTTCNFALANTLKGVKEVGILIEDLNDEARKCNITASYLDTAIRVPLSNSSIKIISLEKIPSAGYIYVDVTVIDDKDFCIGSVITTFNKYVHSERDTGKFWTKTGLLSIRKINFQKRLGDELEMHTKEFIGAWLKANQN